MGQQRLNDALVLNTHRDDVVVNVFVIYKLTYLITDSIILPEQKHLHQILVGRPPTGNRQLKHVLIHSYTNTIKNYLQCLMTLN